MTREELKGIMQTIMSEYKDLRVDQHKFDFWFECLSEYDAKTMRKALCRYAKNNAYPPNIAGLCRSYEMIREEQKREQGILREKFEHLTHIYPYGDMDEAEKAYWEYLGKHQNELHAAEQLIEKARNTTEIYQSITNIPSLAYVIRGEK